MRIILRPRAGCCASGFLAARSVCVVPGGAPVLTGLCRTGGKLKFDLKILALAWLGASEALADTVIFAMNYAL